MKLTNPIYSDENKAREHLEALHWPHGPVCPRCGVLGRATKLEGKSTRPGVYKCKDCRKPFSVTVGTLMERSHIKINVWLAAMHLMTSSKKGMSAHQMGRMLGVSYESAWFLCHRLREAMAPVTGKAGPLGGEGKIVEADTTYVGGKEKNKHVGKRNPKNIGGKGKQIVHSLVERGGHARSHHIANINGETLRPILMTQVDCKSSLMTDTAGGYLKVGKEFARHEMVDHGADEYVRGDAHSNTVEGYFSIFKRGIIGVYHHVSEAHLKRYLAEFDFRYSNRAGLGINDAYRAEKAIVAMKGKRLTYRRIDGAQNV